MCFTWLGLSSLSYHRTQVRSLCTLVIAQSNAIFLCYAPILMYIYDIQYELMQKSHQNHSNKQNRWFYFVKLSSHKQAKKSQISCLLGLQKRKLLIFSTMYAIYWLVPCERARPWLSKNVWELLMSMIFDWPTGTQSWPPFQFFLDQKSVSKKINTPFVVDGSLQNE